jgi:hypothetical protein
MKSLLIFALLLLATPAFGQIALLTDAAAAALNATIVVGRQLVAMGDAQWGGPQ